MDRQPNKVTDLPCRTTGTNSDVRVCTRATYLLALHQDASEKRGEFAYFFQVHILEFDSRWARLHEIQGSINWASHLDGRLRFETRMFIVIGQSCWTGSGISVG